MPVPLHEGDKVSFGSEMLYGPADAPKEVPTRNPFIFEVVCLQDPPDTLLLWPLSAPAKEAAPSRPPALKQTHAATVKKAPRAPQHVKAGSQSPQRVGVRARARQKPGPPGEPPVARQPAKASCGFQEAADKAPRAPQGANNALAEALEVAIAERAAKLPGKQRKAKRGESSHLSWLGYFCRPHVPFLSCVLLSQQGISVHGMTADAMPKGTICRSIMSSSFQP